MSGSDSATAAVGFGKVESPPGRVGPCPGRALV